MTTISTVTTPSRDERMRGGLLGLLVGDAIGVPYEFHDAADVPAREHIDMQPPAGFRRTYPHVPPATWSDDGAQALVLLESLQRLGELDVEDLARGFLRWRDEGWYAVGGDRFDIGIATNEALSRVQRGTPAAQAGGTGETSNGNGSLMRVLPLALWHAARGSSDEQVAADAAAQSAVTHRHPRSQACCAVYCLWATRLLDGQEVAAAWDGAVAAYEASGPADGVAELRSAVLDHLDAPVRGSGYVVHSLLATRHLLLTEPGYADVVRGAVALGEDTDTTAAIAGGLAGVVHGEGGIPARWREALRGRELLDPLLGAL